MRTTLGYGMNPFASASNNNSSLSNQVVGDVGYSQEATRKKDQTEHSTSLNVKNTVLDGQMFDLRKADSIKKIMLMQEDVFRQQVYELHRQFERQTFLMNELKMEAAITSRGNNSSELTIRPQPLQETRRSFSGHLSRDDLGERGGSYSGEVSLTRPKGLNQLGRFGKEPESAIMRNDIESDQMRHSYGLENVNNNTSMRNDSGSEDQIRSSYVLENVNICTSMRSDIGSDDQMCKSYGLENVNNCTSMRDDIGPDDQIRSITGLKNVNNRTSMRNEIGLDDQIRSSYGLEKVNNCTSMRKDIGSDQMRRSYGLENVNNGKSMHSDIGSDQIHRSYGMENVHKWSSIFNRTNDNGSDQLGRRYGMENVNNSMRNDIGSDDQIRCSNGFKNMNNNTRKRKDTGSDDQIRSSCVLETVNNSTRNDIRADDQIRHSYGLENVNKSKSMHKDIGSDDQIRGNYGLKNVNNNTSMGNDNGLENVNNHNMSNDEADEEVDVDLTLSIGCNRSQKRLKPNGPPPPCSNGAGTSSSASLTKRDFREQTFGESSFDLGSSSSGSGRMAQNVSTNSWFISRFN